MRLGWVALVTGALLLGACTTEQELVSDRELLLSAAGFAFRPANTPERQQQLANLPPRQFTYQERNGKVVYLYGDAQVLQMPVHRLRAELPSLSADGVPAPDCAAEHAGRADDEHELLGLGAVGAGLLVSATQPSSRPITRAV